ncbi:hypothetical protein HHL26_06730 [Sphingobium sp. TB-6]|uniref:phage tail length tape measure family protein n=1 Tax=Sphingobium sp. TB-6 TaxID=2728850 RepID=UPI00146D2112|nr:phage tail length tape measure family protein [Sphingobium sp. TB-6]NML88761.1 hypothetical protein [Sphingobium sp. TB-6]
MRQVKRVVGDTTDDIGRRVNAANDNFAKLGQGGKLAGHHIQNLAFQFQDLGVQIASGSNPLTAFVQQGSQISGIMMQAGIGVGGLVKQVGGIIGRFLIANPLVLGAGVAAGGAALAFKGFSDTLEKKAPVDDYIKSLGLTTEEAKKLTDTHVTLGDAAGAAWDMIKEALGLDDVFKTVRGWVSATAKWLYDQFKDAVASVYGAFAATYDNIGLIWKNLPALLGDTVRLAANKTIDALQSMVNAAIYGVNLLAKGANAVLGTNFAQVSAIDLSDMKLQYSAAGNAVAAAWSNSFDKRRAEAMGAFDDWEDRTIARRNARLKKQADELIKDRKDKSAKAANDEDKIYKEMMDARAEAQGNVWKLAQEMEKRQKEWRDDMQSWQDQDKAAREAATKASEEQLEIERQKLEVYLQQLDAVGRMGGLFGSLAGALSGLKTGNFSGVGGKLGTLLGMPSGVTGFDAQGNEFARTIGDELKDVFGKDSEFFKGLSTVLADAATGNLSAGMLGMDSKTEKLGSSIGGALGGKLGTKFLEKPLTDLFGKTLGGMAGPLGSIAGGLLGGVVGGLMKKVKWGAVDLSASGASAARGNSGAAERAAVSVGDNVMSSLNQIADAFGGALGDFGNITIGQRHGDWRVNTTGTSLKKKNGATEFDDDAQGAIAFAIQTAIERGAITGIRNSTQNLLKASGDLQTKLSKALSFEGVFTDLQQRLDPTAYALDQLIKQFDDLRDIFKEAGASAEEYAQLEQLLALKRKDIMDEAAQKVIDDLANQSAQESRFLELIGRDQDALALSRLHELAAMKDSLRPMQKMIYQLEDARAVIEKFGPLADGLKAFKNELLGGTTSSLAFVTSQFRNTAAMARTGDADALGALRNDATAFLDAAKANASSELEYRRALGEVLAATDGGIFAADSQVEYAQLQIDAIAANTDILSSMKAELAVYHQRLIEQGEWVERQFRRWDNSGMPVRNDTTSPLATEAA